MSDKEKKIIPEEQTEEIEGGIMYPFSMQQRMKMSVNPTDPNARIANPFTTSPLPTQPTFTDEVDLGGVASYAPGYVMEHRDK